MKAVKWWGGWSDGEGSGTIIRYLLDEFSQYETGFSDMLSPIRQDSRHAVFMGETETPGTTPINHQVLTASLETLRATLAKEIDHQFSLQNQETIHQFDEIDHRLDKMTTSVEELAATMVVMTRQLQQQQQQGRHPPPRLQQTAQQEQEQESVSIERQPSNAVALEQEPRHLPLRAEQQRREPAIQQQPVEPQTAPRIPTISTWQEAVNQWENGDPGKGLLIPLRSWTKKMRKTDPTRYSQRKQIAKEFIYLGRNEDNMRDDHGLAAS